MELSLRASASILFLAALPVAGAVLAQLAHLALSRD